MSDTPVVPPSPYIIREFNDRGTLWLLEDPASLQEFIRILDASLAEDLDFTQAQRINRSFIAADLQKSESDLIYRVPYRSGESEVLVYVLVEQQIGWALRTLQTERAPLPELEAVLREALRLVSDSVRLSSQEPMEILDEIGLRMVTADSWAQVLRDL